MTDNMILDFLWLVLVATVGMYFRADYENRCYCKLEDKYLPCWKGRPRRLFWYYGLFWFSEKRKPIRFKAYWMERIIQIVSLLSVIIIVTCGIVFYIMDWEYTRELAIVFFVCVLMIIILPQIFCSGVEIYVKVRERRERENR